MNKRYQCTIRGCLGLPVFLLYIFLFCNFSRAAIEHQPKPSVRSDNDVDNDQRKSLLPRSRNKNQITSKIGNIPYSFFDCFVTPVLYSRTYFIIHSNPSAKMTQLLNYLFRFYSHQQKQCAK
jgi:hypothetical protein